MGDIYVHVRMKECCRSTLKELDKRKKKAKFQGGVLGVKSLSEALSEKTIDDAKAAIPGGGCGAEGELERLTRAACVKVCEKHAEEHEGKGETEEGGFWREMVEAISGKPAATKVALPGADGAAGVKSKANGSNGQAIADMAKAKAAEYKEQGVTYKKARPAYPANKHADCSSFVHDVLMSSGHEVDDVTTEAIGTSKDFTPVTHPQPGDVIWQPGHMGIYTGTDSAGHPLGMQMGTLGPAEGRWGPGGWFKGGNETRYYRPAGN
jgi:cell wall-associated NlpC family hydrolase